MTAKILHVSPPELRSMAASLKQSGAHSERLQTTLEHAWGRMDAGWDGYAETGVNASYSQAMNEQSRTIAMLSQMAQALEAIATLIEVTDQACQALFDPSVVGEGTPTFPGDVDRLPPPQGGEGFTAEMQHLLEELLALLANLRPGVSLDDLLRDLEGQPITIAFPFYLGASAAFNPGAVAASTAIYVVYNFETCELSIVLGGEVALGVAGGAGGDVGAGGGVMFFYNVQTNEAFSGSCTNLTVSLEASAALGAEFHGNVTVMYNPVTGDPIVGIGFAGGPIGGAGGDVSATISTSGMNTADVLWTHQVDLQSFSDIPGIFSNSFPDTVQPVELVTMIATAMTSQVWLDVVSGAENVLYQAGLAATAAESVINYGVDQASETITGAWNIIEEGAEDLGDALEDEAEDIVQGISQLAGDPFDSLGLIPGH